MRGRLSGSATTTAADEGRVSMNPVVHVDPIGTVLFPLVSVMLTLSGYAAPLIGWAKPVPIRCGGWRIRAAT